MGTSLDRRSATRWMTFGALVVGAAALAGCGGDNYYSYSAPAAVVSADFTGSGYPGVAVAQAAIDQLKTEESPGFVAVALQKTSSPGTFESSAHFSTQGNPSAMAVGALTPGTVDLVVANVNDASVSVLMQTSAGAATFQPTASFSVIPAGVTGTIQPEDVAVCDVNGDGYPDIVVGYVLEQDVDGILEPVGGGVSYLEQNPSSPGQFLAATQIGSAPIGTAEPYANSVYGIACTNLSGSATAPPDVVITSNYQNDESGDYGMVSIFQHNPSSPGSFLPRIDISVPGETHRVVAADVNGDGLPDIVVSDESPDGMGDGAPGVVVLLQQAPPAGSTSLTFAAPVTYDSGEPAIAVAVGDVNGDGLPDLVSVTPGADSSTGDGQVNVMLNEPSSPGTFPTPTTYIGLGNPVAVTLGKLSGNSLPDIAIADGGGVAVLFNTSSNPGTFKTAQLVGQ
ncbi:MAG: FG-GAP repeat domain-containing protein [Steroidobacteraceae bacterium]